MNRAHCQGLFACRVRSQFSHKDTTPSFTTVGQEARRQEDVERDGSFCTGRIYGWVRGNAFAPITDFACPCAAELLVTSRDGASDQSADALCRSLIPSSTRQSRPSCQYCNTCALKPGQKRPGYILLDGVRHIGREPRPYQADHLRGSSRRMSRPP